MNDPEIGTAASWRQSIIPGMKFYFIRHGESQANLRHEIANRGLRYGLTPKGRQQAEELALRLQGQAIDQIFTSPVLRALETSIILANRLGVGYEVTDALREYDCGCMEGRSDETAWKSWQWLYDAWVIHKNYAERIEGGESFHDLRARFVPWMESLIEKYQDQPLNIACVGHGGIYTMMLPLVLKNVDTGVIERFGFDYTTAIQAELRPEGLLCTEWNGHRL